MTALEQTEKFGTLQCRKFRERIFNKHHALRNELARGFLRYAVSDDKREHVRVVEKNASGNRWMMAIDKKLSVGRESCQSAVLDNDDIDSVSKVIALNSKTAIDKALLHSFDRAVKVARERVEKHGLEFDDKACEPEKVRNKQWLMLARVSDPLWWRHQLKKKYRRKVEGVLREAGCVVKRRAPYISDWALQQWKTSQIANREILAGLFAESDEGDQLSLLECAEASVSNPVNRRNELMVRVRGTEEIAEALKLSGLLLTLTAPSKYHAYHIDGSENEKYNGSDPRRVMEVLNNTWAKIRSALQKEDIKPLGLRVCEPHHDGTPHFHFLLFVRPEQAEKLWEIFRGYALEEDGDEPGAEQHRCDYVMIDPGKGTAAGYVAKYIAKNIDGFGFGAGEEDNEARVPAADGALRARAWAGIWGVRQFQAIGQVSVTVYRELRRLDIAKSFEPEEVQRCIEAADAGDWAAFTNAMGGAWAKRKDQLLRPVYAATKKMGRYGEQIEKLIGLGLQRILKGYKAKFCLDYTLETRTKQWDIRPNWDAVLFKKQKIIEQINQTRKKAA